MGGTALLSLPCCIAGVGGLNTHLGWDILKLLPNGGLGVTGDKLIIR